MHSVRGIGLADVQAVYSGPEGRLWELIMGEQVHLGGMESSMDLAERAGIRPGTNGIDLCCCTGAGMRFLIHLRNVSRMTGVDATEAVVTEGRRRCRAEGLADRIEFVLGDACRTGLPDGSADFVWGEDAWCYVQDKPALIAEAARLPRPGGVVAFTDWVAGPAALGDADAERYLRFMKFPNILDVREYSQLLVAGGCELVVAEHTDRFSRCIDLYLLLLSAQLRYDALRIIGFDAAMMQTLAGEMQFVQRLAHAGKISQALFVARRR